VSYYIKTNEQRARYRKVGNTVADHRSETDPNVCRGSQALTQWMAIRTDRHGHARRERTRP